MKRKLNLFRVFLIVKKDLREFSRDRLWMILSPLSLLMFVGLLRLLPENPVDMISVGVFPSSYSVFVGNSDFSGVEIVGFESREALSAAVLESDELLFGVALADTGSSVELFLSSSVTPAQNRAAGSAVRELCYVVQAMQSGENPTDALPVRIPEFREMFSDTGRVSLKDKLKPMLFVIILLVESLALAGLISVEIEHRTASALLITSATTRDLLLAKILTGVILAVTQVFLFLAFTGIFSSGWLPLVVTALLGAWMASSVGMISGAAGRDFMGTLFLGMVFVVPLLIPAFALLFSGSPGGLLRLIPSYGLVMSVSDVIGKGSGLAEVAPYLFQLLIWNSILALIGLFVLKRKVEAL